MIAISVPRKEMRRKGGRRGYNIPKEAFKNYMDEANLFNMFKHLKSQEKIQTLWGIRHKIILLPPITACCFVKVPHEAWWESLVPEKIPQSQVRNPWQGVPQTSAV